MKKAPTSELTEKNIRAIYSREQRELDNVSVFHKCARSISDFVGTLSFLLLNALFFAVWMGLNLTFMKFDPYPFTLLLIIISIEAIFLSTFVLLSQNASTKQDQARHNLDLQVNLLAEQETTAMIKVIMEMARKLGIPESELEDLKAMAQDTDPEDVLEKIAQVEEEKK